MFNLRGIKALLGEYKCFNCNRTQYFSEKIPCEKEKSLHCIHFNFKMNFKIGNGQNINAMTTCQKCKRYYTSDLKIGRLDSKMQLVKDENYKKECCGFKIEVKMILSEQYFDRNDDIKNVINYGQNNKNNIFNNKNNNINNMNSLNNINNINNINAFSLMNNNQNMNMAMNMNQNFNQISFLNNNTMNNSNLLINNFNNNFNNFNNNINNNNNFNLDLKFDKSNIMEFGKKVQLLTFLDNKTNKKYQIYTSPNLKFKNVLNDLLNQFPEINYNNNGLTVNEIVINLETIIKNINLTNNSIIVIK